MTLPESKERADAHVSNTVSYNDRSIVIGLIVLMILMVCLVVGILLSAVSPLADPDPSEHPAVGKRLPRLALHPLVEGSEPFTLEELRGKVVVINFWVTWCPNCRMDLPHLAEVGHHFQKNEDFILLPVVCDAAGVEGNDGLRILSEEFLDSVGIELTIYADSGSTTKSAFDEIGKFQGYPTTVVLDREGVVQGVWVGYDPRLGKWLTPMVQNLLKVKH